MNGVIVDILLSLANQHSDDWPALVPHLLSIIRRHLSAPATPPSMPNYCCQYPRRPLTPLAPSDPAEQGGDGEAAAHLMVRVTEEVRALLQECQALCKAKFNTHRRDVLFAVGDAVLLYTEHTPLPSCLLLSPRWMGPFQVLACPAPNICCLDIPAVSHICPEFNVERLRPYFSRPAALGGEPSPLPPWRRLTAPWSTRCGHRAGNQPHPFLPSASTAGQGCCFYCPTRSGRLRRVGGPASGPWGCAGGPDDPLLVAD